MFEVVDKTVTLGSEHFQNCRSVGCLRSVGGQYLSKVSKEQGLTSDRFADSQGSLMQMGSKGWPVWSDPADEQL